MPRLVAMYYATPDACNPYPQRCDYRLADNYESGGAGL